MNAFLQSCNAIILGTTTFHALHGEMILPAWPRGPTEHKRRALLNSASSMKKELILPVAT